MILMSLIRPLNKIIGYVRSYNNKKEFDYKAKWNLDFWKFHRERLEEQLKQNAVDYKRDIERYVKAKKHLSGTERSDATKPVSS